MRNKNAKLNAFVGDKLKEQDISMSKLASEIGISPNYLSEILSGKRGVSVSIANNIADFFRVSRIGLYNILGWVELSEDEEFISRFKEFAAKNPDFAKFVDAVMNIEDERERNRVLRFIKAGMEE